MSTTKDLQKKYLQMAQNNQAGTNNYLNAQKNSSLQQASNVLAQKYSNANVNPNQSFYSYGNATQPGYNPENDKYLSAQYNKAMTDYQNYANAQNQANQAALQQQYAQNQAALMYQQGQKYGQSQLEAAGLGKTGMSETSQAGLMNTYANVVNQANRDYATNMNQMYQDLASANRQSAQNLDAQLEAYEQQKESKAEQTVQQQYNILANAINSIDDPDLLAKYMETYKNVADPNLQMQYDYKQKLLKDYKDEQELIEKLGAYGVTAETESYNLADLKPSMFTFIGSNKEDSNQAKVIKYLAEYGSEIPDGTVVDINNRSGKSTWVIYNGKMYKTNRKGTKGYKGIQLADKYDNKKNKNK